MATWPISEEDVMNPNDVGDTARRIVDEIKRVVVGKDEALTTILSAVIAGGHVLIEDVPGVAKTLIARSFADVLNLDFSRIQFTPDLLPGDITGSNIFDRNGRDLEFLPGPLFANIVLADEINRASPKTQSALLEAMQEQRVTVEGESRNLEDPFVVIATQNPIELEGTYALPEAQLDRFIIRLSIGYPTAADEIDILRRRGEQKSDDLELNVVASRSEILEMQLVAEEVFVDPSVAAYIVDLVRATRKDRRVEIGASPRGSLSLFKLSRCRALVGGRDYVIPDDVQNLARAVLSHRIVLKPEHWARGTDAGEVVSDALASIPVPGPEDHDGKPFDRR